MVIHDGRRTHKNLRGTVFSIPKYQHGRHAKNILLAEDEMYIGGRDRQLRQAQNIAERQKKIKDPFSGMNAGLDPNWTSRHVTSTGKILSSNPHMMEAGYGRKNPNANNFKKGKKKK